MAPDCALLAPAAGSMVAGKGDQVCGRILAELFAYMKSHFAMEEQRMSAHGYAKAAEHSAQHAALVHEVAELKASRRS